MSPSPNRPALPAATLACGQQPTTSSQEVPSPLRTLAALANSHPAKPNRRADRHSPEAAGRPLALREPSGPPRPLWDGTGRDPDRAGQRQVPPTISPLSQRPPSEGVRDAFLETPGLPSLPLALPFLLSSSQFPTKIRLCNKWGEMGKAETIFKRVCGLELRVGAVWSRHRGLLR